MKSTAIAHSNLAFIKYWGRKNEKLRLPTNGSFSINLSNLKTRTTVEFSEEYQADTIMIDKENQFEESERVIKHLNRIRELAHINLKAKVMSENSFPSGTGLSSSASGFAALTIAAASAAGLKLSEKELSILARQGSGSACRSVPSGFVEWKDAETSEESYAFSVFPADYWNIVDVVAVVSTEKKDVPTSQGQ
jgi:diphosphomevalonate decarboxylase